MKSQVRLATVAFAALILATACSEKEANEREMPTSDVSTSPAPRGTPYPSDPNASFEILSINKLAGGNLEVLNRRDGPSGVSFSRREISCEDYTYRYLGEGDTLEEARQNGPSPGDMTALTGASASSDIADAACKSK